MRLLKIVVNIIVSFISLFVPKSNKYIVVGGWQGQRYADNSRACYEYLSRNKERLGIKKVFWYTNSDDIYNDLMKRGMDVLKGFNFRSVFWHLRSKVHIIDCSTHDIIGFLSVRCIRIDLWHGTPLKNVGYLIDGAEPPRGFMKKIALLASGGYWDKRYVLAPSPFVRVLLSKIKNIDERNFFISSYPRNEKLYNVLNEKNDNYCVFYLPTFRDNNEKNPILSLDFEELNEYFFNNNINFIIKPHFADVSNWEKKGKYSNISILNSKIDVYAQLLNTNLLITDYSSVYFDFLITQRPVLFYPYDYQYYANDDRGFTVPYNEYTAGDKVYQAEDLIKTIVFISCNEDKYMKKYEQQYNKILKETNSYYEKPNYEQLLNIMGF